MATANFGNKFTFFYTAASPFSQFHPAVFDVAGVKYKCAEQYMMHQKAVLFGDKEIAEKILTAQKPRHMKALGRKVRNFDEDVWKQNRERIITEGSMAKYSQNPELMEALMETRGTYMAEASPRDCVYGIGLGANNPKAKDPKNWRGKNLLGKILTEVRERLIAQREEEKCEKSSVPKTKLLSNVVKSGVSNTVEATTLSAPGKESHETTEPPKKKRRVEEDEK